MKNKYFILAITFLCLLVSERSFGQLDQGDFTGGGRDNVLYQFDASTGLMNPIEGAELDTWKDENGMMYATDDTGNLYADINDDGHFDRNEAIDWKTETNNTDSSTGSSTENSSSNSSSGGGSISWGGGSAGISTGDINNSDDDSSNLIASTDNSGYPSDGGFGSLPVNNYTGSNSYMDEGNYNQSPTNSTDDPLYFNQGPNPNKDLYGITDAVALLRKHHTIFIPVPVIMFLIQDY